MKKPMKTPLTAENDKWLRSIFHKFSTPDQRPKEKRRILPESTPALRSRDHLCCRPLWHTKKQDYWFRVFNNISCCMCFSCAFFRLLEHSHMYVSTFSN